VALIIGCYWYADGLVDGEVVIGMAELEISVSMMMLCAHSSSAVDLRLDRATWL